MIKSLDIEILNNGTVLKQWINPDFDFLIKNKITPPFSKGSKAFKKSECFIPAQNPKSHY
jgi:hypothetical protein